MIFRIELVAGFVSEQDIEIENQKCFDSIVWNSQLIDIGAFVGMPLLNFECLNEFLYDLSSQYILVLSYEQE